MTTTTFPNDGDFRLSPEQAERLRKGLEPVHESVRRAKDAWGTSIAATIPPLPPGTATQLAEVIEQVNRQLAPSLDSLAEVTTQLNRQLAPTLGVATEVLAQFSQKTHIPVARLDLSALASVGRALAESPDLAHEVDQAGAASEDLVAAAELVMANVPPDGDAAISREDLRLGVFAVVVIAWFAIALTVAMTAPDPSLVNWLWNLATRTIEGVAIGEWSAGKLVPTAGEKRTLPEE